MSNTSVLRIELLGDPCLVRDGQRLAVPQPLMRLAASHPSLVRRDDMVRSLHPDVEIGVARNRFRVSLSRLRRLVPLVEHTDQIGLDGAQVLVDTYEVRRAVSESLQEPTVEEEAGALKAILPQLGAALFPDAGTSWELEAQAAWSQMACRGLERLGDLAERRQDHATAAQAAEAMLRHFPYDLGAWQRYLRSMSRTGRAAEAEKELAATRKRARVEGWPFPEELEGWTPEGEGRSELGPELSPGEGVAVERFFRRALASEPALVVEMLGSSSFRPEVVRAPREVLPLLREALATGGPASEARERIQVRVITALGLIEEFESVLEEAAAFLAQPVRPARRRIALLAASFAHAMQGDLARAEAAVNEAVGLAEGPTAEYDVWECRAQRATFWMLGGAFGKAEDELRQALSFFEGEAREGSERDRLSVRGNLGLCLAHQERFLEAKEALQPVVDAARTERLEPLIGLFGPTLSWARGALGLEFGAIVVDGLRFAYRTGPRRAVLAAAHAGRALRELGDAAGEEILREALGFRMQLAIEHNALERVVYAPVKEVRPPAGRPLVDFIRATMRTCGRVGEA